MTAELVSKNRQDAIIIAGGFFYCIDKLGNVVRFKPGRKKKEAANANQIAATEEVKK